MAHVDQARFILFGGKGGVGKTVCSAATGIYLAGLGRKTIVCSADPGHSLSDCFSRKIGNQATKITDRLYAFEVNAQQFLNDLRRIYSADVKRAFQSLSRTVDLPFERALFGDLMELSPPGLDELMALVKLSEIERHESYDTVIVDMAAGLHAVRLLELPKSVDKWTDMALELVGRQQYLAPLEKTEAFIFKLKESVALLRKELTDSTKTVFIPVMTAESLSLTTAKDILEGLKSSHVPVEYLVVNQLSVTGNGCVLCEYSRRGQEERMMEIGKTFKDLRLVKVPSFARPVRGMDSLRALAGVLWGGEKLDVNLFASGQKKRQTTFRNAHKSLAISQEVELILFGGKGGCGKTTCSAALALHIAEGGRKTLVFSTDPQRSLSDVFEQYIGHSPVRVHGSDNLWALQLDSKELLEDFVQSHSEEIVEIVSSATYLTREEVMEVLETTLPGTDEIAAFLTLADIINKEPKMFEVVILDTAPTGHTLRFLEMPELLRDWTGLLSKMRSKSNYIARTFFGRPLRTRADEFIEYMSGRIRGVRSLLTSPRSTFVPVMIAEPMAALETERLVSFITDYGMNVQPIVVNKLIPPDSACGYCATRYRAQSAALGRLDRNLRQDLITVPLFPYEVVGLARLRKFAEVLTGKR